MHSAPKNYSEYHKQLDEALEDKFLRNTLDTFAVAYRANRETIFKEVDERGLIAQIADAKDDACRHMEELYAQFKEQAEKRGVHVHRAATAEEANAIIARIARETGGQVQVHDRRGNPAQPLSGERRADCGRNRPWRVDHPVAP